MTLLFFPLIKIEKDVGSFNEGLLGKELPRDNYSFVFFLPGISLIKKKIKQKKPLTGKVLIAKKLPEI